MSKSSISLELRQRIQQCILASESIIEETHQIQDAAVAVREKVLLATERIGGYILIIRATNPHRVSENLSPNYPDYFTE